MVNVKLLDKLEKLDEKKAKYLRFFFKTIHKLVCLFFVLSLFSVLALEGKKLYPFINECLFIMFFCIIYEFFLIGISSFVNPDEFKYYDDDIISGWYE